MDKAVAPAGGDVMVRAGSPGYNGFVDDLCPPISRALWMVWTAPTPAVDDL
jgi:hypothetical protein